MRFSRRDTKSLRPVFSEILHFYLIEKCITLAACNCIKPIAVRKIICLFFALCAVNTYAQTDPYSTFSYKDELLRMVKIPNSPEAESFTKYGNTSVSLYTGTPAIAVPLYTLPGKELDLPVNLSYDASGVKVEQLASQVGLGWNLNVGGRISRIVNGAPDDYLNALGAYLSIKDATVRQKILQYAQERVNFTSEQAVIDYLTFVKNIGSNYIDAQPDYYSLNVLGINDYIVFDLPTMQPRTLNNPRIKVTATWNGSNTSITGWVITHEDGSKFYFQAAERTYMEGDDLGSNLYGIVRDYYSSWVLTKIESPNKKDTYQFTYTSLGYWQQPFSLSGGTHTVIEVNANLPAQVPAGPVTLHQPTYKIDQQFLTGITHNGKTVMSVTLGNRYDIGIASKITTLTFYKPIAAGDILKKINFNYSYFGIAAAADPSVQNKENIRLKLDNLVIVAPNDNAYQKYVFEYESPAEVPSTISYAQDALGYYNGKPNTILYPTVVTTNTVFQGADRKPDFDYAKKGILKKITYPTGGYTEFEYEPHKSPYSEEDIENTLTEVNYANVSVAAGVGNGVGCGNCCTDQYGNPPNITSAVFKISQADTYTLSYTTTGGGQAEAYLFSRGIVKPNGSCPAALPYDQVVNQTNCNLLQTLLWQNNAGQNQTSLYLPAGCYQITMAKGSIGGGTASVRVYRNELVTNGTVGTGEVARAGIRIRRISDYSGPGLLAEVKDYQYKKVLDGNDSSGVIIFNPTLHYYTQGVTTKTYQQGCGSAATSLLNRVGSSSGGDQPHVAYETVFEIQKSTASAARNGYTRYKFTTGHSGIFSTGIPPNVPAYEPDVAVGKEQEAAVYRSDGELLVRTQTSYDNTAYFSAIGFYVENKPARTYHIPVIRNVGGNYTYAFEAALPTSLSGACGYTYPLLCSDPQYNCLGTDLGQVYDIGVTLAQGRVGKQVSVQKEEFFQGTAVTTLTTNSYEPAIDHLLRATTSTTSEGGTQTEQYWYPKDFMATPVYGAMVTQNRLTDVVKRERLKNGVQPLAAIQTDYLQTGNAFVPYRLKTAKQNNALEERVEYSYDANGNAVQATQWGSNYYTSFIWGYNHTYLLARLENCAYNTLPAATLANLQALASADTDAVSEQALRTALNSLRSQFPNAQVTTYTWDPAVGLTSLTDPRGYSTYFFYDVFNRLERVEDAAGKTLSRHAYQWALSVAPPGENYVKTTAYRIAATAQQVDTVAATNRVETARYFDGLGRLSQTVAVRGGGQQQDLVTPVEYDVFGRQTKEYLPYAAATLGGASHSNALAQAGLFYNTPAYQNTANPYSEKVLESSPLSRALEKGAPGTPWLANPNADTDHTVKFAYQTNAANEVRLYQVTLTPDYAPTLTNPAPNWYAAGQLYKTITKDENWQPADGVNRTAEEFTDKQGRIVLRRAYTGGLAHETYYVYDDYGNLTYVLPPKVTTADGVSAAELGELCYQYRYDGRNRLIEKKIPGKGWEAIVYTILDQPVLTRDANLAAQNKWLFTKYDALGRVVYTGFYTSGADRATLQTTVHAHTPLFETKTGGPTALGGVNVYYTNQAFPTANEEVLTITYYDEYGFDLDGGVSETAYGIAPTAQTRGLATGSKLRALGTAQWLTAVTYYDEKGRTLYGYTKNNLLGTTDKVKHQLDFTGQVLETTTTHSKTGQADVVTVETFTYDHAARPLAHTHRVNAQATQLLAQRSYDALGRVVQQKTGNTAGAPLQTVDYAYNLRGWLRSINDVNALGADLFAFELRYQDPTAGMGLYNGNISQTRWRSANTDSSLKHYLYQYDALNRITQATDNTGNYNLNSVSYDKNGNILTFSRQGATNAAATVFGLMDNLTYSYDAGNKLVKIDEAANAVYGFKDKPVNVDYTYDANGNMITDANKDITGITYNHLNLPTQIAIDQKTISYFYSADGVKQRKVVNNNGALTTTDYAGSYIYENDVLKFINHTEGYLEPNGAGNYKYVYQYKDIWGNTRVTYADDNNNGVASPSEIRREQNYYPFGMEHRGYNAALVGVKNNLKTFQQQEFTEDFGLNTHEWKYRMSDPSTGRFWQIDPLAEDYPYNSTFAFQENKLGLGIELEGAEIFGWQDPVVAAQFTKGLLQAVKDEAVGLAQSTQYIGASGVANAAFDFAPAANQLSTDFGGTVKAVVNTAIESLKTPEGQGYALGTIGLALLDPSPAGETSAVLKTADKVADVASDVAKAANKADFVVTPKGTAIPIPDGATGPTNPKKGSGMMYQGGSGGKGMSKKTTGVRIMDANSKQGRRVNYMNNAKPTPQTIDPFSGNPISNKDPRGHIPIPTDPYF